MKPEYTIIIFVMFHTCEWLVRGRESHNYLSEMPLLSTVEKG